MWSIQGLNFGRFESERTRISVWFWATTISMPWWSQRERPCYVNGSRPTIPIRWGKMFRSLDEIGWHALPESVFNFTRFYELPMVFGFWRWLMTCRNVGECQFDRCPIWAEGQECMLYPLIVQECFDLGSPKRSDSTPNVLWIAEQVMFINQLILTVGAGMTVTEKQFAKGLGSSLRCYCHDHRDNHHHHDHRHCPHCRPLIIILI